ncbi:MAG: flagellar biosynthesis protein FliO, partial [Tardiphaga sp.]|nr:flagellar biosynthesis protein FliO [Tardiphaga sp.]
MQSSSTITFIIAFVVVLALIGLVAYLVRRFGGSRLGANANRGRMPRLAVIDAAAVDGRRRLVLVRRDNVEHLLMIGGPTDIVVESNIIRAGPARDQMTPRSSVGGDLPPRAAPLPDAAGWTDAESRADAFEPMDAPLSEPAPRPTRPTFADEIRRPAGPPPGERTAPLMPSPMIRPEPAVDSPRPSRGEPMMPRPSRAE